MCILGPKVGWKMCVKHKNSVGKCVIMFKRNTEKKPAEHDGHHLWCVAWNTFCYFWNRSSIVTVLSKREAYSFRFRP